MADNAYVQLLERTTLASSQTGEAVDLGPYSTLQWQVLVSSNSGNAAGSVELQHAATNVEAAFETLSGTSVTLATPPISEVGYVSNFLRYVRWATDGSVTGNPVVQIDIIAKEDS